MKLHHVSIYELCNALEFKPEWFVVMMNKELPEDEQMYICEVIRELSETK